jgi:hypothetical protein
VPVHFDCVIDVVLVVECCEIMVAGYIGLNETLLC